MRPTSARVPLLGSPEADSGAAEFGATAATQADETTHRLLEAARSSARRDATSGRPKRPTTLGGGSGALGKHARWNRWPGSSSQVKVVRGSSRLVESFGEFIGSRNVINRCSRYDKIVRPPSSVAQLESGGGVKENNCCPLRLRGHASLETRGQAKKASVGRLLSGLMSRTQANKAALIVSLLRAPTVLAALFSLALVVSLIVLYALSFHSQTHLHLHNYQQQQQQQQQRAHQERQQQQDHHQLVESALTRRLNSRQLQETTANSQVIVELSEDDITPEQLDDDGDDDEAMIKNQANEIRNRSEEEGEKLANLKRALTVQTECGAFVGVPEAGGIAFRGLAYASPPIGARRWARPRPIWRDPHLCRPNASSEARSSRAHCAQLSPVTRRFSGHEDCLYLDIYTPQLNQVKKLPVMVYIHGGFLAYGSSGQGQVNWLRARPSAKLASALNVVLVAFNYRLQALGFLTLIQLAQSNGPDGSEGNYGLWDQLAALSWIKRNIESFSGDPDNIVLFGPDSASALPLALLSHRPDSDQAPGKNLHRYEDHDHHHHLRGPEAQMRSKPTSTETPPATATATTRPVHAPVRDLFRAAWLTNPTVYHELPYERASQHYQRLFLNQSPCLSGHRPLPSEPPLPVPVPVPVPVPLSVPVPEHPNRSNLEQQLRPDSAANGRNQSGQQQLIACLMGLTAEQVVRYYLADDDPSYRLDDQNSLPIHGIIADQFVTVDQELVQDSYPFRRRPVESAKLAASGGDNNNDTEEANYREGRDTNCAEWANSAAKDLLLGSSAQAVEYWPNPRDLNEWGWPDFRRYVSSSLNSFLADTYKRASETYEVPTPEADNHLGPAQEPPKYGPRVAAPGSPTGDHSRPGPKETYLSMVSDIRLTCPINELADSLRAQRHRVYRYVVEQGPSPALPGAADLGPVGANLVPHSASASLPSGAHNGSGSGNWPPGELMRHSNAQATAPMEPSSSGRLRPEFAYHTWDLFAFFGFEFDPSYEPSANDLKFQAQIRHMVKRFVHRQPAARTEELELKDGAKVDPNEPREAGLEPDAWPPYDGHSHDGPSPLYTILFAKNGTRQRLHGSGYKANECAMWSKHLDRSYAWIS